MRKKPSTATTGGKKKRVFDADEDKNTIFITIKRHAHCADTESNLLPLSHHHVRG